MCFRYQWISSYDCFQNQQNCMKGDKGFLLKNIINFKWYLMLLILLISWILTTTSDLFVIYSTSKLSSQCFETNLIEAL